MHEMGKQLHFSAGTYTVEYSGSLILTDCTSQSLRCHLLISKLPGQNLVGRYTFVRLAQKYICFFVSINTSYLLEYDFTGWISKITKLWQSSMGQMCSLA